MQRSFKDIDYTRRPVIGILSEPLRGEIQKMGLITSDGDLVDALANSAAYIPRTHVQFLEQSGVRVVPIDHRLSTEERWALYD